MARAKKPKKEPIEAATRLVIEHWGTPKNEDWRMQLGQKIYIGQQANGTFFLRMERVRKYRWRPWDYTSRTQSGEWTIQERSTSVTTIKVGDGEVDSIIDGLITLKELIKSGRTVKSTITEVKP